MRSTFVHVLWNLPITPTINVNFKKIVTKILFIIQKFNASLTYIFCNGTFATYFLQFSFGFYCGLRRWKLSTIGKNLRDSWNFFRNSLILRISKCTNTTSRQKRCKKTFSCIFLWNSNIFFQFEGCIGKSNQCIRFIGFVLRYPLGWWKSWSFGWTSSYST